MKLEDKILDKNFIEDVNKLSKEKTGGDISICFPKTESERGKIHFLLNTDKIISLFDLSKITVFISDELETENISVQLKKSFKEGAVEKLFEDITPFRLDKVIEIQDVLDKYNLEEVSKKNMDEEEEEDSLEENHPLTLTTHSFLSPVNTRKEITQNVNNVESLKELFIQDFSKKVVNLSEKEKISFLQEITKIIGVEVENIKILSNYNF